MTTPRQGEGLTEEQGVDAGGTVDRVADGRCTRSEGPGGPDDGRRPGAGTAETDGTGNGALLNTLDEDTGGPGREISVGEGA
jgi:hypothetical protein